MSTITSLTIIEVIGISEERCCRVIGVQSSNNLVIGEVKVSAASFEGNPSRLAEELEVNIERETIAGHNKVVSEETSASSDLTHISIGMAKKFS